MSNKPYLSDTVLVIDDEPMYADWMNDYFPHIGLKVEFAETVDSAIEMINTSTYRAYIVDLNIPVSDNLKNPIKTQFPTDYEYPGLIAARKIRTLGESGSRVIIYSVYINDMIYHEIKKLNCLFIQKGRPKLIKDQITQVLVKDPKSKKKITDHIKIQ